MEAKYPDEASSAATQLYRAVHKVGERDLVVVSCEKEVSAAKGTAGNEIATTLHTTQQTVCKWRKRFLAKRTAGLI